MELFREAKGLRRQSQRGNGDETERKEKPKKKPKKPGRKRRVLKEIETRYTGSEQSVEGSDVNALVGLQGNEKIIRRISLKGQKTFQSASKSIKK